LRAQDRSFRLELQMKWLEAYGYGKPSTIDDEGDAPVNPLAGLSMEQILAIAKG
jgi:hypothetical protein